MRPYNDIQLNTKTLLREFNARIDDIEYTWHRDEDDRIIEVFSGAGWQLQLDNQLPVLLESGCKYYIPAGMWHRLHKGQDNLTILISEKKAKPDFLDIDGDGDKEETMKKAAKDKKKKEKDLDEFVETLEERKKKRKKRKRTKPSKNPQYAKGRSSSNKAGLDRAVAAYNRAKKTPGKADDMAAINMRAQYAESTVMDRDTMKEYIEEIIEARRLFKAIEEDYMREDVDYDDNDHDINEKKKRKKRKKKKKSKSGARTLSKAVKKSLDKKADRRCLTRGSVYAEFRAGLGAYYTSGSRKGMSPHQWAHARVNSANPSKSWAKVKKRKKCPKKKKK